MSKKTKTVTINQAKAFADWLQAMPKGECDDMQTMPVNLTLKAWDWMAAAEIALHTGKTIETVLSETIRNGEDLMDAKNGLGEEEQEAA